MNSLILSFAIAAQWLAGDLRAEEPLESAVAKASQHVAAAKRKLEIGRSCQAITDAARTSEGKAMGSLPQGSYEGDGGVANSGESADQSTRISLEISGDKVSMESATGGFSAISAFSLRLDQSGALVYAGPQGKQMGTGRCQGQRCTWNAVHPGGMTEQTSYTFDASGLLIEECIRIGDVVQVTTARLKRK